MLHSILQHKVGINLPSGVGWQEVFNESEDSLTSSVFGSLLHLPAATLWSIVRRAAYNENAILPNVVGELLSYNFWPRWHFGERDVEPDVFLEFELLDLVVEAKRYDERQQDVEQWKREASAYQQEFGYKSRPMIILAVGGLYDTLPHHIEEGPTVVKTRWTRILSVVNRVISETSLTTRYIPESAATQRVLTDVVAALNLHGFWHIHWMADSQYSVRDYSAARTKLMETY